MGWPLSFLPGLFQGIYQWLGKLCDSVLSSPRSHHLSKSHWLWGYSCLYECSAFVYLLKRCLPLPICSPRREACRDHHLSWTPLSPSPQHWCCHRQWNIASLFSGAREGWRGCQPPHYPEQPALPDKNSCSTKGQGVWLFGLPHPHSMATFKGLSLRKGLLLIGNTEEFIGLEIFTLLLKKK